LSASVVWGVLITVITEILSIFGLLGLGWLLLGWGLATIISVIAYHFLPQKEFMGEKVRISISSKLLLAGVLGIIALTGLIASTAAPNNFDSMTYHMSRVMHWIQNRSVSHYPTHIERQLFLAPWAEFAIMHLQILAHGDRLSNLVQWFSMLGSIIGVSLIAKLLGASLRGQIFAAVVAATIPMGILQASSTQNDYVASFWLVCFVYYALLSRKQPSRGCYWGAGVSLGLTVLTKATSYLYAFPFLVWLSLAGFRRTRFKVWKPVLVILSIAFALNFGHYARNFGLYNHPSGPDNYRRINTNEGFGIPLILSNVVRNIGLHLSTPSKQANDIVVECVKWLHGFLRVDIKDPRTTYCQMEFRARFSLHEDFAANFVHLLLIVVCILLFFVWKGPGKKQDLGKYLTAVSAGFLLLCLFIKWNPWNSRYHLAIFILYSPLIGIVLSRITNQKIANAIIVLVLLLSLPWILGNQSRPLIGTKSIFNSSRLDQYFVNLPSIKRSYCKAASFVNSKQCRDVGLNLRPDHWNSQLELDVNTWEYPFWVLLRDAWPIPRIEHVDVKNRSGRLSDGKFKPCVLLRAHRDGRLSIAGKPSWGWKGRYGDGWIADSATLKLENIPKQQMGMLSISMLGLKNFTMLPIVVTLIGNSNKRLDVTIDKENLRHRVNVSRLLNKSNGEIDIKASKTWRPIDFEMNEDDRALSVLVKYEPSE
jgi:hypothetical protein